MKKPELRWDRLTPPGIDFRQREFFPVLSGLVLAGLWTLGILQRFFRARDSLYDFHAHRRILRPDAVMAPFSDLIGSGLLGFELFALAMVGLGIAHHLYHRRDSMSIYLMKRLPDRREYWIRCWAVPVLSVLVSLVLIAALLGIYYLVYRTCTPVQCLI